MYIFPFESLGVNAIFVRERERERERERVNNPLLNFIPPILYAYLHRRVNYRIFFTKKIILLFFHHIFCVFTTTKGQSLAMLFNFNIKQHHKFNRI